MSIVASKVDGIPEGVEDGDSALLVEPADADALHRALARVVGFDQFRGGHYWDPAAIGLPGHSWSAERDLIDERIHSGLLRWLD